MILVPCFRLKGVYFAIGTFVLGEILRILFLNFEAVGGAVGLHLPLPQFFNPLHYYYLSLIIALAIIIIVFMISNSRIGLAFMAIRESEEAAEAFGVNALKYKALAFNINAFFNGLAGGFYAYYIFFVDPRSAFSISWSLEGLFMTIVGGGGTVLGPIIGAIILALASRLIVVGEISLIIYGTLIIMIIMAAPQGIYGVIKEKFSQSQRRMIPASAVEKVKGKIVYSLRSFHGGAG
jgi:branched-chain amino acid transport system permease protein